MSTLAWDVKARKKVPMRDIEILRTQGTNRYRLSGVSDTGTKLSRFISAADAKSFSKKYGPIRTVAPKMKKAPRSRKR